MEINLLTAISPVDGRYREKVKELAPYFSEFALIKYRTMVEIEYFIALCDLPLKQLEGFEPGSYHLLRDIYKNFSETDANRIKDIEKITNHDVKAVEYFLKEKFKALKLDKYQEFLHFGLTSQDINNTAIPCLFRDSIDQVYYPLLEELTDKLTELSDKWAAIPMLARTHGQPASPTRLGKEIQVFVERLKKQIGLLKIIPFSAKFGGATGNFNAHVAAYPEVNWVEFADTFVNHTLGLERSLTTTQIDHYDHIAAIFDNLKRINTVLIDFSRDIWTYISMDYFKQKIAKDEIGSSAMPHKVNPIDFENAEGNLGMANAIFEHLSAKLPVSRLQRDLTDSTVIRNIGVPMAHTVISLKSLLNGLSKIFINDEVIKSDLEKNWIVIAEGIQTILRREGYENPYEALKDLTRTNNKIDEGTMKKFINGLKVNEKVREELLQLSPFSYTGICP